MTPVQSFAASLGTRKKKNILAKMDFRDHSTDEDTGLKTKTYLGDA